MHFWKMNGRGPADTYCLMRPRGSHCLMRHHFCLTCRAFITQLLQGKDVQNNGGAVPRGWAVSGGVRSAVLMCAEMIRLFQEVKRRPRGTRLTGQIYGLRGKSFKENTKRIWMHITSALVRVGGCYWISCPVHSETVATQLINAAAGIVFKTFSRDTSSRFL